MTADTDRPTDWRKHPPPGYDDYLQPSKSWWVPKQLIVDGEGYAVLAPGVQAQLDRIEALLKEFGLVYRRMEESDVS